MDLTDDEWAAYLARCHDGELAQLQALNAYYEGGQPLAYMHPELLAEIGEQIRQVVVNWPRLVVDAVEERLDVEGFRYPGADEADAELWRIWQANGMDEQSQMAHVDALVMRRAFLTVGSNPRDAETPLVTAESPLQMYADFDPATREVRAALKRWNDVDPFTGRCCTGRRRCTGRTRRCTTRLRHPGRGGSWTAMTTSWVRLRSRCCRTGAGCCGRAGCRSWRTCCRSRTRRARSPRT